MDIYEQGLEDRGVNGKRWLPMSSPQQLVMKIGYLLIAREKGW